VTKSDTELIKVMAKKCKNPLYTNMILEHLASMTQDLEAICETIGKVQQLAKGQVMHLMKMAEGRRKYT
jgi:hypothetical protein